MNQLFAGFGRVNATPMLGIDMPGYYFDRFADGVLDELEVNALALACGEDRAVLLTLDHEGIRQEITDDFRAHVARETGIPVEGIYIHAVHVHTGGSLVKDAQEPLRQEYYRMVYRKMADAARLALEDLKPARMGVAVGTVPNVAFIRRFRMKDGSIQTNPGVNHPDIVEPIGQVDESVGVVRFDQEQGNSIVLVNFACHPDTVGGCKLSADWPGAARRTLEKCIDGVKCIVFNGAEGDVNHVKVHPVGGDCNDLHTEFDGVRGYGHTRYIGRAVAGGVLQVYDKVKYTEVESLRFMTLPVEVPANVPDKAQMPEAHRIYEIHQAGGDSQLPYSGMMLTTVVAEACRMVRLENGPESFRMVLSGIAVGNVALIGIPGEPFTGIGRGLKETEGWDLILPTCLTNGHEGYFPMKEAYDEGGYEARSSNFRSGAAELLIREGKKLLDMLKC